MEEKFKKHDEILDDHEDRIRSLEISDTETKTELKHLIKEVEKLVKTIERFMNNAWILLLSIASVGIGFIIWYIQKG